MSSEIPPKLMENAVNAITPDLMTKLSQRAQEARNKVAGGVADEDAGRVAGGVADEDAGRVEGGDAGGDAGRVEGGVAGAVAPLSPKEIAINEATKELEQLKARDPPATQDELEAAEGKLATANAMEGGRRRRSRRRSGKKSAKKTAKKSKKGGARKSKKVGRSRKNGSKRRAHRKH